MSEDVYVEHVNHKEWGLGEITEVSFDTGDPLVSVEWPNGRHGSYWIEELEFLVVTEKEISDTRPKKVSEYVEQTT